MQVQLFRHLSQYHLGLMKPQTSKVVSMQLTSRTVRLSSISLLGVETHVNDVVPSFNPNVWNASGRHFQNISFLSTLAT